MGERKPRTEAQRARRRRMRRPIEPLYRDVGERVAEARRRAGLTQRQLADRIGFIRISVSNIETARQRVPVHVLAAIARVCGCSLRSLLPSEK